ncbi:sigma-70 family RNA polymerase sigma factor [Saccharothrix hoggarensis]
MRTPGDAAAVTAAQRGEPGALDALVAAYLPLVYNVVGHALAGHPDTDDVVQETMLRALHGLPRLREPEAFRSWLLAIALNQVRDHHRTRLPLADAEPDDVADPGADFADLAITRLRLTGQRRELAAATRWIGDDDRELLSLWWLEQSGRITRAELASALDLTPQHAAVRVQRMKAQLDAARVVVRVLALPRCGDLAEVIAGWDGQPSALWRKRIVRHARECARCGRGFEDLAAVDGLLARIPLVPLPVGFDFLGAEPVVAVARKGFWAHAAAKPLLAAAAVAVVAGAVVLPVDGWPEPLGVAAPLTVTTTTTFVPTTTTATTATTTTATTTAMTTTSAPATQPVAPTSAAAPAPAPTPAPAPAPVAKSAKKGVATWHFDGVTRALSDVGAGWFYNWATTREDVQAPPGVEYVPMIWGAKHVTPANLEAVKGQGATLLGFNEPDLSEQSNLTVEQALDLWPRLQATGMRLGSPAVAHSGDKAGGWLDRFLAGARQRGLRVDFITVHWYGSDFGPAAVGHLKNYLDAVHARYGLPIWLTEYSLMDFSGGGARYPDERQLADFAGASSRMLEGLPYLERYAWFALPADKPGTGLYLPGGTPNRAGEAYRATG